MKELYVEQHSIDDEKDYSNKDCIYVSREENLLNYVVKREYQVSIDSLNSTFRTGCLSNKKVKGSKPSKP